MNGWNFQGDFFILVNFLAPGSGSAFPIRIQEKKVSADPDPQHRQHAYMDPHYFWKLDPDPHKNEKLNPDQNPRESQIQKLTMEACRLKWSPGGSTD
jgi:hypothetical protein